MGLQRPVEHATPGPAKPRPEDVCERRLAASSSAVISAICAPAQQRADDWQVRGGGATETIGGRNGPPARRARRLSSVLQLVHHQPRRRRLTARLRRASLQWPRRRVRAARAAAGATWKPSTAPPRPEPSRQVTAAASGRRWPRQHRGGGELRASGRAGAPKEKRWGRGEQATMRLARDFPAPGGWAARRRSG